MGCLKRHNWVDSHTHTNNFELLQLRRATQGPDGQSGKEVHKQAHSSTARGMRDSAPVSAAAGYARCKPEPLMQQHNA